MKIGERMNNLERPFNLREGMNPTDDSLPWSALNEPIPDGPSEGAVVNLEPMLNEYYAFRGWDRRDGSSKTGETEETRPRGHRLMILR